VAKIEYSWKSASQQIVDIMYQMSTKLHRWRHFAMLHNCCIYISESSMQALISFKIMVQHFLNWSAPFDKISWKFTYKLFSNAAKRQNVRQNNKRKQFYYPYTAKVANKQTNLLYGLWQLNIGFSMTGLPHYTNTFNTSPCLYFSINTCPDSSKEKPWCYINHVLIY